MKRTAILLAVISMACACCNESSTLNIVPQPNVVHLKNGQIDIAGMAFNFDSALDEKSRTYIESFSEHLALVTGMPAHVSDSDGISFIVDSDLEKEEYSLKVGKKGVEVRASGLNGFIYAIQTMKQMLPVEVYGKAAAADKEWTLPCCVINDAPRFGYRGMHMDVSRHFFDMDMVKKYIDIMEMHKLNTLHWHLTDDQGWRIEIKKYPLLTEVGSIRKKTLIGHAYEGTEYDTTPYGEG